jgi:predicted RNase H-like HicB family nuclease
MGAIDPAGGAMARRFTVIFEKEEEGGYHVFCPTLPGCHTQSETIEEGLENIREAIQIYIQIPRRRWTSDSRRRHFDEAD